MSKEIPKRHGETIEKAESIINRALISNLSEAEDRWGLYEMGCEDNPHSIVEQYNTLIKWFPNQGFKLFVNEHGVIDFEEL